MKQGKEKISPRQFMVLVLFYTVGSAVLFLPSILTKAAKQDAWISSFLSIGFGILLVWFYAKIAELYPDKTYSELTTYVLGKFGGGLVNGLTFLYFFILTTLLMWDIGDFIITQIMPETPIHAIFILFMLVVIYGVRLGIETLSRAVEIFLPWILLLFVLTILFLVPNFQMSNLTPVLENGIKPIFNGVYRVVAFPLLELIIFLMITTYVYDPKTIKKSFTKGVAIGTAILMVFTFMSIGVLGAELTTRNIFPIYALAKKINIGDFLQRVEVLVAILWFLTLYFKLAITFHVSVQYIGYFTKIKDTKPLILPLGMLTIVLTMIFIPSSVFLKEFDDLAYFPLSFLIGLILPMIVFVAAKIKKKKETG